MKYKKYLAIGLIIAMSVAGCAGCGNSTSTTKTETAGEEAENEIVVKVTEVDGDKITAVVGTINEDSTDESNDSDKSSDNGLSEDNASEDKSAEDSSSEDNASKDSSSDDNASEDKTSSDGSSDESGKQDMANGEKQQMGDGEEPPEMPDGESFDPDNMPEMGDGQEPPEMPDGEGFDSDNMPQMGDGEEPPEKPDGDNFGGGEAPDMGGNGGFGGFGSVDFEESDETITFTITDDTEITEGMILKIVLDDDNNAVSITVVSMGDMSNFGSGNMPGESKGNTASNADNGTAVTTITSDGEVDGDSYTSEGDDENALRVDGASVTLNNITVDKTGGDSSNTESGDFYGMNAGLLACNGAEVTIMNAIINTDAVNGNGVFSYGEGTVVNISDSTIRTTKNNSGGIQTTGGGTTNATNLDVQTEGNSSAAIRSDRGGGTVNVSGGTYVTNGTGSPAIYSTAAISAENAVLTANNSEGIVVEGKNSVSLTNCTLTGNMSGTYNGDEDENIHCIMLYQSMSGDADEGTAEFTAESGSITALQGDMFYVTNTDAVINLKGVAFTYANDTFLRVEGNSSSRGWGTEGSNGGNVELNIEEQTIDGNIIVDDISTLNFSISNGSSFNGTINSDGEAGEVSVTIDEDSTWTLTGDAYITEFNGDTSSIVANGYHVYVNGEAIV